MSIYAILEQVIDVFYSKEDKGYIANVCSLPGCSAFGETLFDALKEAEIAINLRLEELNISRPSIANNTLNVEENLNYSSILIPA